MISTDLPERGFVFWPVGTGDSTTIVIDNEHVVQVDLHDTAAADDDEAVVAAIIDRLVEVLPERDGRPYLSAFILTHADQDHCRGFADLLEAVTIGELWATPRLWREYLADDEDDLVLCDDAKAFQEEAERRVAATLAAVEAGSSPEGGDRIRVIGYDTDNSKHAYSELPDEFLSYPGETVTLVDGEAMIVTDDDGNDVTVFGAFIHAPFKDDCAAERNETSVALQITLRADEDITDEYPARALLLGDLSHDTIMKIFDYSETHDREDKLEWDLLLAPHHCSKKVMYIREGDQDVLHEDVLDALERHGSDDSIVISSSAEFRATDKPGDNPPHLIARDRYMERANDFICTGEYPTPSAPQPVVLAIGPDGLALVSTDGSGDVSHASKGVPLAVAGGLLAAFAATAFARRRSASAAQPQGGSGLDRVRDSVASSRGQDASPQQPVGFGRS
jgi:beta-lactamase superfamily II metal-dependent hydrolase